MLPKNKSIMYVLGCAGATILVFALIGGAILYKFLGYQRAGLDGLQNAPQASVLISAPQPYSQAPEGAAIPVSVSAHGYQPLVSSELWVNGTLMGVQAAPPGGQLNLDSTFVWFPGAPGEFSLVARTLDTQGNTAVSTPVLVNILPHVPEAGADSGEAFDTGAGMAFPPAPGGAGGGGMPGSGDSVGPAQLGAPSPGDWLNDLTNKQPPQAPGLAVAVKDCTATLSIHDLSNNEEGFQVFRSSDDAPAWAKIATLNSQSVQDWITYADSLKGAGQASYYVVAVNKIGQAKSNLVTASFSVADCKSDTAGAPQLSIQLTHLKTDSGVDRAYCYKSLNGSGWSRWPAAGFFTPGADGFDIQGQADSLLLDELDGKSITLDLECWGWAGGALKMLGKLHKGGIGPGLDHIELTDGSLVASLGVGGVITTKDGNGPPKPATGPSIPTVFAILFHGPNSCKEHLPSKGNNLIENLLFCTWFPIYNQDEGASQPYLVWYVSDPPYQHCLNGQGANCNSFQFYLDRVKQYGGQVGFHVYSQFSDSIPLATTPHDLTAFVVPPQAACGQQLLLTVRVFWLGGPNDPDHPNEMRESIDSNTISSVYNCPPPSQVKLNVTFKTLTLSHIDDGESDPEEAELYGAFQASSSDGSHGSLVLQNYEDTPCPDDSVSLSLDSRGTLGCGQLGNGSHSIGEQLDLCTSDQLFNCPNGPAFMPNNTIQLTVGNGDHLFLNVMLTDHDKLSADDPSCMASLTTAAKSIEDWADTPTSGLGDVLDLKQSDNGNAACDVEVDITQAAP